MFSTLLRYSIIHQHFSIMLFVFVCLYNSYINWFMSFQRPKKPSQKMIAAVEGDDFIRRNPSRHARSTPSRFDLPYTRSRRRSGSVSSSISSASSTSPSSTPEVSTFFQCFQLSAQRRKSALFSILEKSAPNSAEKYVFWTELRGINQGN